MRQITLTGHLHDASGNNAVGWVQVAGLDVVLAPEDDVVISLQPVHQQLMNGSFAIPIELSTEPGSTVPALVELHQLLEGTRPVSEVLNVQTTGDTIDIADAPRVILFPSDGSGVPVVSWSVVGQPGGVAPLDSAGRVPAQYLPASSGGSARYQHDQLVAATVWGPIDHDLGYRPAAVSVFSTDYGTQFDEFVVQHLDINRLRISMDTPTTGIALIS
jgi:hypothetical protein